RLTVSVLVAGSTCWTSRYSSSNLRTSSTSKIEASSTTNDVATLVKSPPLSSFAPRGRKALLVKRNDWLPTGRLRSREVNGVRLVIQLIATPKTSGGATPALIAP